VGRIEIDMRGVLSLFQTAAGAWHLPSILAVAGWLAGSGVTGAFIFANLKVNRDDRVRAYHKEQQSITDASQAKARIEELEQKQRPRAVTPEQRAAFIEATKGGPFGPVVLATRTALPNKEQEDFTMGLRKMLDSAGFGNKEFDIINGFSTGVDPKQFLSFVSNGDVPPSYFSNVAGGLHKIGLVSPDAPVAIKNPNAKPGVLYVFIPEK
jgi:hypothetical protein